MDAFVANFSCVSLQDLLRSVPIFKNSFKKLIFARKFLIFNNDSLADLGQISFEVHKYKLDLKVTLLPYNKTAASSPSSTPLSSTYACAAFVNVITKNKAMYK